MKATDEEANAWKATAIDEIRRIWIRWGHPALTKFSYKLGIYDSSRAVKSSCVKSDETLGCFEEKAYLCKIKR